MADCKTHQKLKIIVKLALVYKKVLGSRRYLAHVFYALSIRYERHAARACFRFSCQFPTTFTA